MPLGKVASPDAYFIRLCRLKQQGALRQNGRCGVVKRRPGIEVGGRHRSFRDLLLRDPGTVVLRIPPSEIRPARES